MKNVRIGTLKVVAGALLASLATCAQPQVSAPEPDETGVVVLSITNAPADAACLRITVKGATTAVRSLPLATGVSTAFTLEGLPSGAVQFTAEAFDVACPSVSAESIASWVSDAVAATLQPGQASNIALALHRPGRANVSVDFPLSCGSSSACPAGMSCVGGVCKKADGSSCAVATDCVSGACLGGVCSSANNCGSGPACAVGQVCVGGACKTPDGGACAMSVQCASGLCSGGLCKRPDGAACLMSGECASGLCSGGVCTVPNGCGTSGGSCPNDSVCVNGACKKSDGGACAMGGDCVSGLCVGSVCRKPDGAVCQMSDQCASGLCSGGVCTVATGCGTSAVCSPASVCVSGACKKSDGGTCTMGGDCVSGLCVGSVCRKPDGAVCQMSDQCASGLCSGGVCTVATGCGTSAVCSPGSVCVSGACKKSDGGACAAPGDCASGLCLGGTCSSGPSPGPALQWKFDESSGSTAIDASGNGRNGTYLGTSGMPQPSALVPALGAAVNPSSRVFVRASEQAIRLAATPAALKPANGLTLGAWYRATSVDTSGAEVISAGDNYILRLRATQIEFDKRVLGSSGSGIYVNCIFAVTTHLDGAWHHLAAVSSTSGMKLYFDGLEKCSNSHGENLIYDRGPDFWVGRHGNGQIVWDFEGNLDDVRVYPRALTAAEITALAAAAQ